MNNFYDTISRDVNKAILENESQIFELKKEEIINQKLKEKGKEIERLNNIIKKAIVYVLGNDLDNFNNINNLLNILKGSDKE